MPWVRIASLLAGNPELVNQRTGEMQLTPLHIAAERGDIELTRLLLRANPDLDLEDASFGGTPLGWAHHFQRAGIIELIEKHQARRSAY